jgi:hypothetical protein
MGGKLIGTGLKLQEPVVNEVKDKMTTEKGEGLDTESELTP